MKRLFILLVFILTAGALCAQYLPPARQRNTKPKGNRNAHSYYGTSVVYQRAAADSTSAPVADQVQQAIDTVPAGSSAIETAMCEEAPAVRFNGAELTLDCDMLIRLRGKTQEEIFNDYCPNCATGGTREYPNVSIKWYPDWLHRYGTKTRRETEIEGLKNQWSQQYESFQMYSLPNGGNIIMSYVDNSDRHVSLAILKTFDQGKVSFFIPAPNGLLNNPTALAEWRSQMETEAVDFPIPTPYR